MMKCFLLVNIREFRFRWSKHQGTEVLVFPDKVVEPPEEAEV